MKKTRRFLILQVLALGCTLCGWAETEGSHFRLTLGEAGTLKQRLNNAVMATDYDLVDSLTLKGKLGGADLAYIQAQEGFVSQLRYLDIADVELVADGVPYASRTEAPEAGLGLVCNYTYYVGADCHDERAGGTLMATDYNCFRNDLSMAFYQHSTMAEVRLPKSLPGIGERIFMRDHYEQSPLRRVVMPDAPAYIGGYAFYSENETFAAEYAAPLDGFTLPATVDSIGPYAFHGRALGQFSMERVRVLGNNCFERASFTALQIGPGIGEIPRSAFQNSALAQVDIPATVSVVGPSAFEGSQLTQATIGAEEIGNMAFRYCQELASVTLLEGVKRLGEAAFDGCWALAQVDVPSTIEEIGAFAFASTPWSRELKAEADHIVYIGRVAYAIQDIASLTSLVVKEGTVSLAANLCEWCGNAGHPLSSISLPASLRIIGDGALATNDFTAVSLPDGLEKIGRQAFAYCSKLRRITIPASVRAIGEEAFANSGLVRVYYNAVEAQTVGDNKYFPVFPESLMRAELGEGVRTIPNYLFNKCKNMTRLIMPSTVEYIGASAFASCTSLEHIDLPAALRTVGEYALAIDGLKSVTSYVRKPFNLFEIPSDDELKERFGWRAGEAWRGNTYVSYCLISDVSLDYEIDADGNVTITPSVWSKIPQLQVAHDALAAYQDNVSWAASFQQISSFDAVSDAETLHETTSVSVTESVTEETDLTGALMGNVYVTLDTQDSGDGYNATEGCLVINSTVTADGLAAATAQDADALTVKNQFNGLIFEVPAGRGSIAIDCQTLGRNVLYVKAGSAEPRQVESSGRSQVSVPYEVAEPTRIYVYAAQAAPSAGSRPLAASVANDDAVKLYGLTVQVDVNGIQAAEQKAATDNAPWYDLNGRRLPGAPAQRGIYVRGGRKVWVK